MVSFLVVRENDRFQVLLDKGENCYVLETSEIAPPFEAFRGRRKPDLPRESLEQREEIREGGSRLIWDRGELRGQVIPEAPFEVELRGQRLIGRYRFEDRGEDVAVSRGSPAGRSRMPLVFLVFASLAALIAAALFSPAARVQLYLALASESELVFTEDSQAADGWSGALIGLDEAALPVLISEARIEARHDRSAFKRSLFLLAAQRVTKARPRGDVALNPREVHRTEASADFLEALGGCLSSPSAPALRIEAWRILDSLLDARCFELLIRSLRSLVEPKGTWVYGVTNDRTNEAAAALETLKKMAILSGAVVSAEPIESDRPAALQPPWPKVFGELTPPAPGSPSLGAVRSASGRIPLEALIDELEAWLASEPPKLPAQIKAP